MKVKQLNHIESRPFIKVDDDTNSIIIDNKEYYPKVFKLVEDVDNETDLPINFTNHVFKYHDDGNIYYEIKDKNDNVILTKKMKNRKACIGMINEYNINIIQGLALCRIINPHPSFI